MCKIISEYLNNPYLTYNQSDASLNILILLAGLCIPDIIKRRKNVQFAEIFFLRIAVVSDFVTENGD